MEPNHGERSDWLNNLAAALKARGGRMAAMIQAGLPVMVTASYANLIK